MQINWTYDFGACSYHSCPLNCTIIRVVWTRTSHLTNISRYLTYVYVDFWLAFYIEHFFRLDWVIFLIWKVKTKNITEIIFELFVRHRSVIEIQMNRFANILHTFFYISLFAPYRQMGNCFLPCKRRSACNLLPCPARSRAFGFGGGRETGARGRGTASPESSSPAVETSTSCHSN